MGNGHGAFQPMGGFAGGPGLSRVEGVEGSMLAGVCVMRIFAACDTALASSVAVICLAY